MLRPCLFVHIYYLAVLEYECTRCYLFAILFTYPIVSLIIMNLFSCSAISPHRLTSVILLVALKEK